MVVCKEALKSGFETVFSNESFKCAFITYSEKYTFGEIREMKRHNLTDEVFLLLRGRAVMLICIDGVFETCELSRGAACNVPRGTWHYLAVSEDACVFVCERSDTDGSNTDSMSVELTI